MVVVLVDRTGACTTGDESQYPRRTDAYVFPR